MTDRLSGIAAFVNAVEAGSFALAASRMHLSRSAVGKSIARLEARLGVRLFHRTTRSQKLTAEGEAFYERCVRALAELEEAQAALDDGRLTPSGRLRVSAPVLFGRHCIAPILLKLAEQYPALELEMSFNDRVVDLVEEGIDLAVRVGSLADNAGLVARRLGSQSMVVCASPGYLAERGKLQSIADLSDHTGITYVRSGRSIPWQLQDADRRTHEVRMTSRIRFDDMEAMLGAAAAGLGLAWLPCWLVANHLRAGVLVRVLDASLHSGLDIHAVWPRTRHMSAKVRAAVDALVSQVPVLMTETVSRSSLQRSA
jgi:DNA-binding transcriptional LysR family regulator